MGVSIEIDNVTKAYQNTVVIEGLSATINPGEFFTLLGPSGCGKTTLLRMIIGFNSIEAGEIRVDGKRVNDIPTNKRNMGMVFQNYAVFPHMTVADNVAYGLKARRIRRADRIPRVLDALKLVQIADLKDRMPDALSGGQQQRVALARAFVIEPGILLMDEPLSNLDAKLRVQMRGMIKKLQQKLGITTVYVTHDQEEALAISDRIAVMNQGHILQVGKPDQIYRKPQNLFVANFIGNSNQMNGAVTEVREGVGTFRLDNGYSLPVELREDYTGPAIAAVRPEYFFFDESGMPGVIDTATFLGDFVLYEVALGDGQMITVNEYGHMNEVREAGDKVNVAIKKGCISLYKTPEEVISC